MNIEEQLALWNQASVDIISCCRIHMEQGDMEEQHRISSHLFLVSLSGSAQIKIDQTTYNCAALQIIHSGKDSLLTIVPSSNLFEYYAIYYDASIEKETTPFLAQYWITPAEPLLLYTTIQLMDQAWHAPEAIEKFKIKSLFYQFIHYVLTSLHSNQLELEQMTIPAQIAQHLRENYAEPISLESLAAVFNYSVYHLSSLFKVHTGGVSPIDYLIRIRLERATELLTTTNIAIKEIAASVGYKDMYYFSRIFKKRKGVSPAQFRIREAQRRKVANSPANIPIYSIVEQISNCYIDIDNHYRYNSEGDLQMIQISKSQMVASFLLCLSLVLGACSTGSTNNVSPSQTETTKPGSTEVVEEVVEEVGKTRIVATVKGDVEIPAEPKRVAADQYMGHLLKLGIVPIGAKSSMLDEGWMEKADISKELIGQIEDLGDTFPVDLEKLTMLDPDLIIGSGEEQIEQYEKIGTTIYLPYWEGSSTADPMEKFRSISKIFGKENEAEEWIAGYEQKVIEGKEKIAGIVKEGETVSVISFFWDGSILVLAAEGGNYGAPTIYEMLELPATEHAKNMENGFESVSFEVLPEYLGDHVFVYNGEPETIDQVMQNNVWKNIPAVKNGNVYLYGDSYYDEFLMEDPYSLEQQLDTIVNILLDANTSK